MTFDEWIKEQPEGVAACDHVTFGRMVWEAATKVEREECAKVCESLFDMEDDSCNEADKCAAAIRARSI